MAEYIEREAAIALIREQGIYGVYYSDAEREENVIDMLTSLPAADVAPVVHGRWEFLGVEYANCTNCGGIFEAKPAPYFFAMNNKFCRWCGARMDGE